MAGLTGQSSFLTELGACARGAAKAWFPARKDGQGKRKLQVPWFVLGFFALAASRLLFPGLSVLGPAAAWIARKGMVLALFLVGTGLTVDSLRRTGPRVLWLAVALWLSVLVGTYWAIR